MPITSADFGQLTDELEQIFEEYSKVKIADQVGKEVFDVFTDGMLNYEYQELHGGNVIESVAEGQDLPSMSLEEGDNAVFTHTYYGGEFSVTKKMRKFDQHRKIRKLPRTMVDEAWDLFDQSLVDVLLNGWSTSYTDVYGDDVSTSTAPDGNSLFNTSHTFGTGSQTYSNVINDGSNDNPSLTRAAIVEERASAMKYSDAAGLTRPIKLDTLLVGPSNEDLAERILFSDQMSGTANNDTNPLKGKINNILVWERLDQRSDGTDTSGYWFMFDSRLVEESLMVAFAERPTLDAPEQVYSNKNWDYSVDYFYWIGVGHPAFIRGSQGTN